jgi:HCOMODA/2-hydroxy-3-carboxy-muconic semialdehyde decarboxylase
VKIAVFRAYYTDVNARLLTQAIGLNGDITYLSAEEGAKADSINFAVIDRVWNLWKQKVQATLNGR